MANIKVAGNAVIVTSSLKLEDLKQIAKYKPDRLVLREYDEDLEATLPVFRVIVADGQTGYLDNNGAVFGRANADGYATATMVFDPGENTDVRSAVVTQYGAGILRLNRHEEAIEDALRTLRDELGQAFNSITVIE